MAVLGVPLEASQLVLTRNRDFRWGFEHLNKCNDPADFPPGRLYFEFSNGEQWEFTINGSFASVKVEHEVVDALPSGLRWQLVWLPEGEPAGGDPLARGAVKVQG